MINTTNNYWADFSSVNPSSDQSGLCTSAADARMAIVRAKEGIWARIPDHRLGIQTASRKHHERLAAIKTSKIWFPYSHNCTLSNGTVFHSVCQIWLSSGPPEFLLLRMIVNLAYESQEERKHGRNWSVLDKSIESPAISPPLPPPHPTPPRCSRQNIGRGRLSHALIFVYIRERNI